MSSRRKAVSVIGPNQTRCNVYVYNFGLELGRSLADAGYVIICGGMFGFMEAVCKGARSAEGYTYGCTVGILPSGMGWARNQLIINSADVVVSVAGGTGTLSELAYAWQAGKTVICYTQFDGWTKRLAGTQPDINRKGGELKPADSIEQILKHIKFGV